MARPWHSVDEPTQANHGLPSSLEVKERYRSDNILGHRATSTVSTCSIAVNLDESKENDESYQEPELVPNSPLDHLVDRLYGLKIDSLKASQLNRAAEVYSSSESYRDTRDISGSSKAESLVPGSEAPEVDLFNDENSGFQVKKLRGIRSRPALDLNIFEAPASDIDYAFIVTIETSALVGHVTALTSLSPSDVNKQGRNDTRAPKALIQAVQSFPGINEQIRRHQAGQYQFIITVPDEIAQTLSPGSRSQDTAGPTKTGPRRLACNLLSFPKGFPADDKESNRCELLATEISHPSSISNPSSPAAEQSIKHREMARELENHDDAAPTIFEDSDVLPASRASSSSSSSSDSITKIEDSQDTFDQYEAELAAATQLVQTIKPKQNMITPTATRTNKTLTTSTRRPVANATPMSFSPATTLRQVKPLQGSTSHGNASRKPPVQSTKPPRVGPTVTKTVAPTRTASKPPLTSRPASLAPPKPVARSTKPPTTSTFTLPGEIVAQQLKERRDARRSMQGSSDSNTTTLTTRKSSNQTRVPTVPSFELPGEAISRRKKEEHAARIKAEEEELRRRREFKAKPVRHSLGPGTFVRETAASRARQSATPSHPQPQKRISLTGTLPARSRASMTPSMSEAIRSTSSSMASHTDKRNINVGAEVPRQHVAEPSRAQTMKAARDFYGQRSRVVSREKVEKQKLSMQAGQMWDRRGLTKHMKLGCSEDAEDMSVLVL